MSQLGQDSVRNIIARLTTQAPPQLGGWPLTWPIKGVRVDGDKVIIAVNGGNEAARWLCGELVSLVDRGA